ncbi:hypothetical protein M8J77_026267 [Diaphorina citri]|nr:hypothetical protein M8J77_026267 [Diaphorina citri]
MGCIGEKQREEANKKEEEEEDKKEEQKVVGYMKQEGRDSFQESNKMYVFTKSILSLMMWRSYFSFPEKRKILNNEIYEWRRRGREGEKGGREEEEERKREGGVVNPQNRKVKGRRKLLKSEQVTCNPFVH